MWAQGAPVAPSSVGTMSRQAVGRQGVKWVLGFLHAITHTILFAGQLLHCSLGN